VTDANGCVTSDEIILIAPEPIEFSIAELHPVTCAGDNSGILEIQSATNTIGAISYLWSSGETQPEITNKRAGMYSATVTDEQGCSSERSHALLDPPAYSVNVITASDYNGSAIRCSGENDGKLTAIVRDEKQQLASADNFTWYREGNEFVSGPSFASVSDLGAGLYKVEIAYRTFCKTSDTFILTEPAFVQVAISAVSDYHGVAISCAGGRDGAMIATATGGTGTKYSYTWNTGHEGPEVAEVGAGTYLVTALDINGCPGTAQRSLTEPDPFEARISILSNYNGQPVSCADASDARIGAVAIGGTSPYSYIWNSESTGMELVNVPPGKYHLTAKDVNGCTAENDTTVLNPARVIGRIASKSDYHGFGVSCNGMADGYLFLEASGGTGKYSFRWQNSTNTRPLHSNLRAGTYQIEIHDENGCAAATQEILTQPEVLTLEVLSSTDVSCNKGNNGQIELVAAGGSGSYQYSASGVDWNTASILKNLKAGVYDPIVKDANGCHQSIRLVIGEPQQITIDFKDVAPALCGDPRGEASASVTGGTGDYKFEWRDTRQNIVGHTAHISFLPAGIFTLHILDANSCKAVASVGISSTDGPKVAIDNIFATTCSYSADGVASVSVTGEHPPFTIQWADGHFGSEASDLRKGDYFVEVTDEDNCSTVETISIPSPDSLVVELVEKVPPSCNGTCDGKLTVTAAGGNGNYQYTWESSSGNSIEGICKGDHTVEVSDQKGCVAKSTIQLPEPESIELQIRSATSPVCPERCEGALEIEASGGVGALQFRWSLGETTRSIMNLCAGEYTLTVSDSNHCEVSEHYTLEPPEEHSLDLGGSIVLCKGQTHILDPGALWESFSWNSNAGFQSHERRAVIANPGTYWIEAVDKLGCVARDTFLLETSTELLKANFLLASQAFVEDTIVIIDISWPVPGEITWTLPEGMKELVSEQEVVYGQFDTAGSYDVTLTARLGECRDHITKSIVINDEDGKDESGRFGHNPFLKEFMLYPNPNDGMFDVVIEFEQESLMQVTIWNVLTSMKVALMRDSGRAKYSKHVDLRPLSSGSYSLRLDYEQGTRYIRFIVK
jgi:SprB repeat